MKSQVSNGGVPLSRIGSSAALTNLSLVTCITWVVLMETSSAEMDAHKLTKVKHRRPTIFTELHMTYKMKNRVVIIMNNQNIYYFVVYSTEEALELQLCTLSLLPLVVNFVSPIAKRKYGLNVHS